MLVTLRRRTEAMVQLTQQGSKALGAEAGTEGDQRCGGQRGARAAGGPPQRPGQAGPACSWVRPEGERRPWLNPVPAYPGEWSGTGGWGLKGDGTAAASRIEALGPEVLLGPDGRLQSWRSVRSQHGRCAPPSLTASEEPRVQWDGPGREQQAEAQE
ncbi:hypothetical protein NDU88_002177 [Pleurodeles waltl]|uniref:Uncharacterized protein n=1 Tax=Pleurodeles waltl TaxID=8319 RepID=A0AAV7V9T9_PLEWA|nr:hypothetical protein NDU88_002177 [Pleurodeles waltl]